MKTIKSKRWYDNQMKARENAIINLTKLKIGFHENDVTLNNRVFTLQNEFNELKAERDLYYA